MRQGLLDPPRRPPNPLAGARVYRLDDGQGTSLAVGELGAAWLSCRVPLGGGGPYRGGDGFALEPQFLPDAPNHPEWPARCRGMLQPGDRLDQTVALDFTAL